jgi:hypothetical protein
MILGEGRGEEPRSATDARQLGCEEMAQGEYYLEEAMILGEERVTPPQVCNLRPIASMPQFFFQVMDTLGLEDVDQEKNAPVGYSDQDGMVLGEDQATQANQMPADTLDPNFNGEDLILEEDSGDQPTVSFMLPLRRGRSCHLSPPFPRLPMLWIRMNLNGRPRRISRTCSAQ